MPATQYLTERQREIAAYNATVVGNLPLAQQPYLCPVGLEETQGQFAKPPPYRPISFAAEREWRDENDGWQTVRRNKKRRARKVVSE